MHFTIKSQNEPGVSHYRLSDSFAYEMKMYSENVVRSHLYDDVDVPATMKDSYRNIVLQSRTQLHVVGVTTSVIINSSNNKVQEKVLEIEDGPQEQKLEIEDGSQKISIPKKSSKSRRVFKIYAIWKFFNNLSFKWVKLAQILCGMYILTVTFVEAGTLGIFGARSPDTGMIIDANPENTEMGIIVGGYYTQAIVAESKLQMVLLGISRFSGFFMYPAVICVFCSKLRSIQSIIEKTPFNAFIIHDAHSLHVYCGWVILVDCCVHTTAHCIRWAIQGNLYLLTHHQSGITGLIVLVSTFIIVLPMGWTWLKVKIRFEIRKCAHYLFWIFCAAMTFHAHVNTLPNGGFCAIIFPSLFIVYALDAFFAKCLMTERIDTVHYRILDSGVELSK